MLRTMLIVSVLLAGIGCRNTKTTSSDQKAIDQKAIVTKWYLVSHDASIKKFTSNKEEVTPRRGYEMMAFDANGTCTVTIPGPTDRPEVKSGTWKWKSESELVLIINDTREVLQIVQLSADRLEINKQ